MIHIPNLPPREELVFKEKSFFLSLYEQFTNSRNLKILSWILVAIIILAWPLGYLLEWRLTVDFIENYLPPAVNSMPYQAQDLQVRKIGALDVRPGLYSIFSQIVNLNAQLSAKSFDYQFILKDSDGKVIQTFDGQNFVFRGESKFLLLPSISLAVIPDSVELRLSNVRWTSRAPDIEINLGILQQNSGVTAEGNFFVEGLMKNFDGFGLKQVAVQALVFNESNQDLRAVNATVLSDIKPFEARYFRLLWPETLGGIGQIQVDPILNLLDPGLVLEETDKAPAR